MKSPAGRSASERVKAIDRNLLTPTEDGATVFRMEESMAAPLVGLLFSEARLREQHRQFRTAVKAAAEAH